MKFSLVLSLALAALAYAAPGIMNQEAGGLEARGGPGPSCGTNSPNVHCRRTVNSDNNDDDNNNNNNVCVSLTYKP